MASTPTKDVKASSSTTGVATSATSTPRKDVKASSSTTNSAKASSSTKKRATSTPRKDVKISSSTSSVGTQENGVASSVENEMVKGVSVADGAGAMKNANVISSGASASSVTATKETRGGASPRKEVKVGTTRSTISGKGQVSSSTTAQKRADAPIKGTTFGTSSVEKIAKGSSAVGVRERDANAAVRQSVIQEGASRVVQGSVSNRSVQTASSAVSPMRTSSTNLRIRRASSTTSPTRTSSTTSPTRASSSVSPVRMTSSTVSRMQPTSSAASPTRTSSSVSVPSAPRTVFAPSADRGIQTKGTVSSSASSRVQVPQSMASRIGMTSSLRSSSLRPSGRSIQRKGGIVEKPSQTSVISSIGVGGPQQEVAYETTKTSSTPSRVIHKRRIVQKVSPKSTLSSGVKQSQGLVRKEQYQVGAKVKEVAPKVVKKESTKPSSGPIPTFSKEQIGMASVMTTMNRMAQVRRDRKAYKKARRAEKEEGFMNLFGPSKGHYVDKRNIREEDS